MKIIIEEKDLVPTLDKFKDYIMVISTVAENWQIDIKGVEECPDCSGAGYERVWIDDDVLKDLCPRCGGKGVIDGYRS